MAVAPVPMMPTRLPGRLVKAAVGVATGVRVVPAAGVERVALVVLDARDPGSFGRCRMPPARQTNLAFISSSRLVRMTHRAASLVPLDAGAPSSTARHCE